MYSWNDEVHASSGTQSAFFIVGSMDMWPANNSRSCQPKTSRRNALHPVAHPSMELRAERDHQPHSASPRNADRSTVGCPLPSRVQNMRDLGRHESYILCTRRV